MKKKIVFVFLTFFVSFIVAGQNKKPVTGKAGIDTLHHQKGPALLKGKQISATKSSGTHKLRRKDSLKAMNDPMTKLEKPGHDSLKLSKPGRSFSEDRAKQKRKPVK